MSRIEVRVKINRGRFQLDVDLQLPGQGVTALFGHSGSGKTTLLRAIAGLDRFDGGYVALGESVWQDSAQNIFLPLHRRSLGYIFQEPSLFEHLNVLDNLEYGLKRTAISKRHFKTTDVAELMGISHLFNSRPMSLSGGERQRVAISRALLTSPDILLMDEPLSALDLKRKHEILPYLENLHRELSIPIVFVSHSPDEVARLADHLVLLDSGQVIASGSIFETLARVDLPQAFADDAGVVIDTVVARHDDDGLSQLNFEGGQIHVSKRQESIGERLRCRIHARDVSLVLDKPASSSILNVFQASVQSVVETDVPGHVLVQLRLHDGVQLLARITQRSKKQLNITKGQELWAQVKSVALLG